MEMRISFRIRSSHSVSPSFASGCSLPVSLGVSILGFTIIPNDRYTSEVGPKHPTSHMNQRFHTEFLSHCFTRGWFGGIVWERNYAHCQLSSFVHHLAGGERDGGPGCSDFFFGGGRFWDGLDCDTGFEWFSGGCHCGRWRWTGEEELGTKRRCQYLDIYPCETRHRNIGNLHYKSDM